MFQSSTSRLSSLVVHYVGNKLKDEDLRLSDDASGMDEPTKNVVWDFVTSAFKAPDFYQFTHAADLELNSVYSIARELFKDPGRLVEQSSKFARLLFEASQHPQVKSGELLVIYFEKLVYNNISAPAIALFKSERKQPFLFTEEQESVLELFSYKGISPAKVDKACLIFNDSEEDGYNLLCVDNLNRGEEAKFWMEDFLKVKSRSTEFSKTTSLIEMTKSFIDTDLGQEYGLERDKSIDLLNKSKDYFKESEEFEHEDFGLKVFEDKAIGDRFKDYVASRDRDDMKLSESFPISQEAVKKKQRVFKSVLKLDKNFHVYIHGNREMVEKGVDENGRKYYKLYYDEES